MFDLHSRVRFNELVQVLTKKSVVERIQMLSNDGGIDKLIVIFFFQLNGRGHRKCSKQFNNNISHTLKKSARERIFAASAISSMASIDLWVYGAASFDDRITGTSSGLKQQQCI